MVGRDAYIKEPGTGAPFAPNDAHGQGVWSEQLTHPQHRATSPNATVVTGQPSQLTEKTQVETGKRTWLDCQNLVGVGIGI